MLLYYQLNEWNIKGGIKMRIIFTAKGDSWSSLIDERLGRTDFLVIYDEQSAKIKAISNEESLSIQHAGPYTAQKIIELSPDVIVTGNGPGRKAYDILKHSGIRIYIGAGKMSLHQAYDAFKADQLELL